eukprot:1890095-Rhodomonas_salina.1
MGSAGCAMHVGCDRDMRWKGREGERMTGVRESGGPARRRRQRAALAACCFCRCQDPMSQQQCLAPPPLPR